MRVRAQLRQSDGGVALGLHRAGARNARRNLPASLRWRRQDEIGGGHRRHLDVQVDTIDERAREPSLIFGRAACVGAALAGKSRLARTAAAAGIHRGHQHETRRIGHAVVGPGDRNLPDLERLAERVEDLRLEFRNYVAVSPMGRNANVRLWRSTISSSKASWPARTLRSWIDSS